MCKYKCLIFDFDGTLADSLGEAVEVFYELSSKYGIKSEHILDMDYMRGLSGRSLIKAMGVPWWRIAPAVRDGRKHLRQRMNQVQPFAEISELLHQDLSGHCLYILSSNSEENVRIFLNKHDLNVFEKIYGGSSLLGKARHLRKILREVGVKTSEVLYIGDEVRDVEACHKVGIDVAAVCWGFNNSQALSKSKPTYLVESVSQLKKIIHSV